MHSTLFEKNQKCLIFKKAPKLTFYGIFNELLSTQNVKVARFARNVECDFFGDFQTLCKLFGVTVRLFFIESCERDIESEMEQICEIETGSTYPEKFSSVLPMRRYF